MQVQLKYGIVSDVKKGFVKVSLEEDEIVTDWLPVLVRKSKSQKESWQLEVQEHVICLMDEHCNDGICIGAIPNDEDQPDPGESPGKFRKKFSDGTEIEYSVISHVLKANVSGNLVAKATGNAEIEAGQNLNGKAALKAIVEAPAIELIGNVKITGTATITGALSAATIATTGGGSIVSSGNMQINGSIQATGDIVGAGKSLSLHVHGGVQNGGGVTTPPQ
jgi:phage baseplate assembly protein V